MGGVGTLCAIAHYRAALYDIWFDMIYMLHDMIWYDIWYDKIWNDISDMNRFDFMYEMIWYDMLEIDQMQQNFNWRKNNVGVLWGIKTKWGTRIFTDYQSAQSSEKFVFKDDIYMQLLEVTSKILIFDCNRASKFFASLLTEKWKAYLLFSQTKSRQQNSFESYEMLNKT